LMLIAMRASPGQRGFGGVGPYPRKSRTGIVMITFPIYRPAA
jgi:hypothetical protein